MGILDRISTILRSNINALLDQAEDPELVLEQILRDMSEAIGQARGQVAEMIAQEKLLQADVEKNRTEADQWQRKAELAVTRGREDLAREALSRKRDYAQIAETYMQQLVSQSQVVTKLKHDLGQLQTKYESATRNKAAMIARHKAAVAQQKIASTAAQLTAIDPSSELARMEAKIRQEEARAQGLLEVNQLTDVDAQFMDMEHDDEIEQQLTAMKQKMLPDATAGSPLPDDGGSDNSVERELAALKRRRADSPQTGHA